MYTHIHTHITAVMDDAESALCGSAGRALLAEVEGLRRFVRAYDVWWCERGLNRIICTVAYDAMCSAREALAQPCVCEEVET